MTETTTSTAPAPPTDLGDSQTFWAAWWRTAELKKGGSMTPAERAKLLREVCLTWDQLQAMGPRDKERAKLWERFHSGQHRLGICEEITFPAIRE
jgi:hypothetical protein